MRARRAAPLGGLLLAAFVFDASLAEVPAAPVATVAGSLVTADEFEARVATRLAAQRRLLDERIRRLHLEYERARAEYVEGELERYVDSRVLGLEAAARGIDQLELFRDVVVEPVTDAQVREFHAAHAASIGQPYAEAAGTIRQRLENDAADRANRAYLDQLRTRYDARVLREPRRETVAATGPARGPEGAPVVIVAFVDFQCPYCAALAPLLESVVARHPEDVRVVIRHLPLAEIHPEAVRAAEASVCAEDQGRFWEYHDAMYAAPERLDPTALSSLARTVGLDVERFDACVAERTHGAVVAADLAAAAELGLSGTPALFVNGRYLNGLPSELQLARLVVDERDRVQRRRVEAPGAPATAAAR